MTFTYDLTNEIGQIRNFIPDKNEASPYFLDEEITSFLSRGINVNPNYKIEYAVMFAWLALGAQKTEMVVLPQGQSIKIHRIELTSSSKNGAESPWLNLAEQLRKTLEVLEREELRTSIPFDAFFGGLSNSITNDYEANEDNLQSLFNLGMFDNRGTCY